MVAVWVMIPAQNFMRDLAAGGRAWGLLAIVVFVAAALVAIRKDLPDPPPVRPALGVAGLAIGFLLFVFVTETAIVAGLKGPDVRDFTARRVARVLLLQSSLRDVAENARSREVRGVALELLNDSTLTRQVAAADAARFAADSTRTSSIMAESDRVRNLESPLAGTWRIEITISGERPMTVYARSTATGGDPLWPDGETWTGSPPDGVVAPATGYSLPLMLHRSADSLPARMEFYDGTGRNGTATLYLAEASSDPSIRLESTLFRGLVQLMPGGRPPLDGVAMHSSGAISYRGAQFDGERGEAQIDGNGGATFVTRVTHNGSALITVTGTRISREVCAPRL
jgi:hypothetical protein